MSEKKFANAQLERAFLGIYLKAEKKELDAYRRGGVTLGTEDFSSEARKFIFSYIAETLKAGKKPQPALLLSKAGDQSAYVNSELFECAKEAANAWGLDSFAADIRALAVKKHLSGDLVRLADDLETDKDPGEVMHDALQKITDYSASLSAGAGNVRYGIEAFNSYLKDLIEIKNGRRERGLLTGLPKFDFCTGGLRRKTVNIIAARPGIGKSALALNIAIHALKSTQAPVIVFSLEMPSEDIAARACAIVSGVSMHSLESWNASTDEWDRMIDFFGATEKRFLIEDGSSLKPSDVDAVLARVKARAGEPALVVIDYLQLMQSDYKAENQNIRVTQISRDLKILSGRYNCPFLVLSQMNRASQKNEGGPQNSDLRDSGAIEQDADTISFLTAGKDPADLWLSLTKNRRGGLKTGADRIKLHFNKETQEITEEADATYGNGEI